MVFHYIPALEIFMAILGFGFTIMFCTAFCRVCHRFREQQMERQAERPPSVYFIPFPRGVSRPQGEDLYRPPPYSAAPPPSYNELGLKPDDLPPAYGEYVGVSICPVMPPPAPPPPLADMVHPRAHS